MRHGSDGPVVSDSSVAGYRQMRGVYDVKIRVRLCGDKHWVIRVIIGREQ